MRCWIAIFLLLLPGVVSSDWISSVESAVLSVDVSESANVIRNGADSKLLYVRGILDFYPRNDSRQTVRKLVTNPAADLRDGSLVYEWQSQSTDLRLALFSEVLTTSSFGKVTEKVKFPVSATRVSEYVKPSLSIDIDQDIALLASELAEGEDDLFVVVFKLADWVANNVEYVMIPATTDAAQKSSWVMRNRIGVCDEMTSLFIAMVRSVGIPAKYVSGYAFNVENPAGAPHAWAEVFFPGYGWIPFDVAFGEYGYLDASHIKLRESVDADVPTSRYEWKGYDVDLLPNDLQIKSEVLATYGKLKAPFSVELYPFSSRIGLGSYNYVEARVNNPNPFYVAAQLHLNLPSQVEANPEAASLLLRPFENKSAYFVLKLSSDLDPGFVYSIPMVVRFFGNFTATDYLLGSDSFEQYSLPYIQRILDSKNVVAGKAFASKMTLSCRTDNAEYYDGEIVNVACSVRNNGNTALDNVRVCQEDDCQRASISPGGFKEVTFDLGDSRSGSRIRFSAYYRNISAHDEVIVKVIELPRLSISDLKHPNKVSYAEDYFINFKVHAAGDSARNVLVIVNTPELAKGWDFPDLNQTESFAIGISGKSLSEGPNRVTILVSYYDRHLRRYDEQMDFSIELQDVTVAHKIMSCVKGILAWIKD
ncbi:MAG: transglutaminase-like domain-containing protein [Candidatus Woesearchaeota archaeon]